MKTILLTCLLAFIGWKATAQSGTLTIKWTYLNVVDGYDHENKIAVWVDGERMGESSSYKSKQTGTFTLAVPTGAHAIRVVGYAYYGGKWEEHTIENDYSVDAILEENYTFGKKNTLSIAWDLDRVKNKIAFKGGKAAKAKVEKGSATLVVNWAYTGINEGYDHTCRTKVYIDDVLYATSGEQLQSKRGKMEVTVPKGLHRVRIVNETLYEGTWEEHTKDNEYSVDAYTDNTVQLKSQNKVTLLFDIAAEDTTVTWDNR